MSNLEKVYCVEQSPRSRMTCYPRLGYYAMGESCEQAEAQFKLNYGAMMLPYEFVHRPMPRPWRRGDDAPRADGLLEHESAFRKSLLRHFHSDLVGTKRRFSADQVVSAINECWESTGKSDGKIK